MARLQKQVDLHQFFERCSSIHDRLRKTPAHRMARFAPQTHVPAIAAALHIRDALDRSGGEHRAARKARRKLELVERGQDSTFWEAAGRKPPDEEEKRRIFAEEKGRKVKTIMRALEKVRACGFDIRPRRFCSEKSARTALAEAASTLIPFGVFCEGSDSISFRLSASTLTVEGVPFEFWATSGGMYMPFDTGGMADQNSASLFLTSLSNWICSPHNSLITPMRIVNAGHVDDVLMGEHYNFRLNKMPEMLKSHAACTAVRKLAKTTFPATYESVFHEWLRTIAVHETMHVYGFINDEISAFLEPMKDKIPSEKRMLVRGKTIERKGPSDYIAYHERWARLVEMSFGNPLLTLVSCPQYFREYLPGSDRPARAILADVIKNAGEYSSSNVFLPKCFPLEQRIPEIARELLDADFRRHFGKHFDDMLPVSEFERVMKHRFITPKHRPMLEVVCGIPYSESARQ